MEKTQSSTKSSFQPDSDVHITLVDQQQINKFARYNAKYDDIKLELKSIQNELKNLEDAVEELVLLDEGSTIPFLAGEVFIHLNLEETNAALEKKQKKLLDESKALDKETEDLKELMASLKSQLYEKFGNHINLEADEE